MILAQKNDGLLFCCIRHKFRQNASVLDQYDTDSGFYIDDTFTGILISRFNK